MNSAYSVGEYPIASGVGMARCHTLLKRNPWEKRYSRRTHTRNLLAEKSLPQMSTDVHRLGGYGIPAIPTLPAQRVQLCKSVKYVGEKIFPQNARNSQKLLAEKSLPQMARMFTDIGGYGIPAIPTLTNSVNSVGEQRT